MHVFKHPKYYKELRSIRNKSDQAISSEDHDGDRERAPGPGHKLPDSTMVKQRASSSTSRDQEQQAASTHPDLLPKHGPEYYAPRRRKRQATSEGKLQATSSKRQASE